MHADGTLGVTIRVDDASTAGYNPVVASDGDNAFVVVWHTVDGSNQSKIYARRYSFTQASGFESKDSTPTWINTSNGTSFYPGSALTTIQRCR